MGMIIRHATSLVINSCDREWREREARVTYGRLLAHRSGGWPADWFTPYSFRTIAMLLTTSCPHAKPAMYPVTPKSSRTPTLGPPACRRGTRASLSLYAPTADNKQQRQHSAAIGPFGAGGPDKVRVVRLPGALRREPGWPAAGVRTAVPFLVVFLAVHPSTYRTAGLEPAA